MYKPWEEIELPSSCKFKCSLVVAISDAKFAIIGGLSNGYQSEILIYDDNDGSLQNVNASE